MLEGADVGVVRQALGVAPGDLVGAVAEVVVAERLEPGKHRVDLGLLRDEGGQRLLARPGVLLYDPRAHLRAPA